jgi:outer membrane autotransporter protein
VTYTPSLAFYGGSDSFTYTATNPGGASAPATVTITVAARPDPSADSEVLGTLNAQANSARRFVRSQISNFGWRLDQLHDSKSGQGFQNNLRLSFNNNGAGDIPVWSDSMNDASDNNRRSDSFTLSARDFYATTDNGQQSHSGGITVWTSGIVNVGTQKDGGSGNSVDFNTSGISMGADLRLSPRFAFGGGIGYGYDDSDIGNQGSHSRTNAYNFASYASYRPSDFTFIDGLIGYQWLAFDLRRYVTANGNLVKASRKGSQLFGSVSAGFERHFGDMMMSPYGRFDLARAHLDAYTEHGDAIYALHYEQQTIGTTSGSLGLRTNWTLKRDFGTLLPMFRVEYQHDFEGNSTATMQYANASAGPLYRTALEGQSRDRMLLGLGLQSYCNSGLTIGFEYQNLVDNSSENNQSIRLSLEFPFNL